MFDSSSMPTHSEENYLKSIFHLTGKNNVPVATNAIADVLHTKASSVTDMIQKMAKKKWIHYEKYQGVTLTKKGRQLAALIVRKHRLWEVFLVEKLGFKWDEIHEIAEQLEHIHDEKLIDKLDLFLGSPKLDPHGDPIPDKMGNMIFHKDLTLDDLKPQENGIIVAVKEHTPDFLQYLESIRLMPGAVVKLLKVYDYDNSLLIENDGVELHVSDKVSQKILIQKEKN